ncbi:MAG: autotransporter-associated beta strand repeat-containing protein, partial [Verrucomicrobiae bacterium]|nr:autotransporter-associated beta strand repeat-containing protein [Verrucomicrobiae bacterium]
IITNLTGSGNLIKRGSGTLVLTAANGYSGTTLVDVGTLVVNGSIASSSLTTVDSGGFLKGSGTVGALTITDGGAFSPGNSPGTINAGNTTWDSGGSYVWEINDVDAGAGTDPGWDLLNITGTLNVVSNFTIYVTSLTLGNVSGNVHDFNPAASYTWKVAQTTGGVLNIAPGDILLNLSNFTNPYTGSWSVSWDANNVYINYFGTTSVVPEPSSIFLLVIGAGLVHRQWRRVRRAKR